MNMFFKATDEVDKEAGSINPKRVFFFYPSSWAIGKPQNAIRAEQSDFLNFTSLFTLQCFGYLFIIIFFVVVNKNVVSGCSFFTCIYLYFWKHKNIKLPLYNNWAEKHNLSLNSPHITKKWFTNVVFYNSRTLLCKTTRSTFDSTNSK